MNDHHHHYNNPSLYSPPNNRSTHWYARDYNQIPPSSGYKGFEMQRNQSPILHRNMSPIGQDQRNLSPIGQDQRNLSPIGQDQRNLAYIGQDRTPSPPQSTDSSLNEGMNEKSAGMTQFEINMRNLVSLRMLDL